MNEFVAYLTGFLTGINVTLIVINAQRINKLTNR